MLLSYQITKIRNSCICIAVFYNNIIMCKRFIHVIDFVILTDRPVVYKDDSGEMVTDLAYQTDFTDMVHTQHAKLQEQFAKGSLDFDVTMADDFKPAGTTDSKC